MNLLVIPIGKTIAFYGASFANASCHNMLEGIFAQKYKYCKYTTGIVLYYKYILIENEVCEWIDSLGIVYLNKYECIC